MVGLRRPRLRAVTDNDMLSGIPLFPEQASTLASEVDNLYFFVTAVTAFFALLVVICVVVFAIKYRDRTGDRVGAPITGSIPLELGWSIVPFFISMAIFGWATAVFFDRVRAPDQTLQSIRPASDGCGGSSISTDRARSTSCTCRSDGPSR